MIEHRPFRERVLDAIIILHNLESQKADPDRDSPQAQGRLVGEIEEPILTFLRDKGYINFDEGNIPQLNNYGKCVYGEFQTIINQRFGL